MSSLGIDVVILNEAGQVLLTLREDFRVWCLPGGAMDDNESVAEAARREAREETGLEVELIRLIGLYSRPRWRKGDHSAVFLARPVQVVAQPDPVEVLQLAYFDPTALPERMIWWQRQYIDDGLAGLGGSAVRSVPVERPFGPELSRQEVYARRDRGELPQAQIDRFWQQPADLQYRQEI